MKKLFLLFILLKTFVSYSQETLYTLHPSVGQYVSKEEKKMYFLFPEISDSGFTYCIIKNVNTKYTIESHYVNESVANTPTDLETLQKYHENISKLDEYYANKSKGNSGRHVDSSNPLVEERRIEKQPQTITLTQQMQDEAMQNARMKEDAIRMSDYKNGTLMDPSYIEIGSFHKKPKKKN